MCVEKITSTTKTFENSYNCAHSEEENYNVWIKVEQLEKGGITQKNVFKKKHIKTFEYEE